MQLQYVIGGLLSSGLELEMIKLGRKIGHPIPLKQKKAVL